VSVGKIIRIVKNMGKMLCGQGIYSMKNKIPLIPINNSRLYWCSEGGLNIGSENLLAPGEFYPVTPGLQLLKQEVTVIPLNLDNTILDCATAAAAFF
jgi:hypothetical protein